MFVLVPLLVGCDASEEDWELSPRDEPAEVAARHLDVVGLRLLDAGLNPLGGGMRDRRLGGCSLVVETDVGAPGVDHVSVLRYGPRGWLTSRDEVSLVSPVIVDPLPGTDPALLPPLPGPRQQIEERNRWTWHEGCAARREREVRLDGELQEATTVLTRCDTQGYPAWTEVGTPGGSDVVVTRLENQYTQGGGRLLQLQGVDIDVGDDGTFDAFADYDWDAAGRRVILDQQLAAGSNQLDVRIRRFDRGWITAEEHSGLGVDPTQPGKFATVLRRWHYDNLGRAVEFDDGQRSLAFHYRDDLAILPDDATGPGIRVTYRMDCGGIVPPPEG